MAMTIDKAYLIALWLEAVFYGINSVLVWACLFVLTHKKNNNNINRFLVATVIIQYLVSTADVSLGLARLVIAFINDHDLPGGPIWYFTDIPNPTDVAQLLLISINSIINDFVIVWRCYHVWGRSWKVIAFPFTLVIATFACAIGQGISFRTTKDPHNVFDPSIVGWNKSFYILSISTNIITTFLISSRIWNVFRTSMVAGSAYTKVLTLVIESGMMYSTTLLIGLGLYLAEDTSVYIVYQQFGQLGAIVPTLILLLVGLKLTSNDVQVRMVSTNIVLTTNIDQTTTTTSSQSSSLESDKHATFTSSVNFPEHVAVEMPDSNQAHLAGRMATSAKLLSSRDDDGL